MVPPSALGVLVAPSLPRSGGPTTHRGLPCTILHSRSLRAPRMTSEGLRAPVRDYTCGTRYATGRKRKATPTRIGAKMGWRPEVREMIAQLEQQRARLEQVRLRARRQGGPEGERLEAQTEARLRDIDERIGDLRAALGE